MTSASASASAMQTGIVAIDGSMLEGGGQVLRNASALAAITGQVVEVSKIRAARAKPGLAAQHLTGIALVNTLCSGRMQGGELRSGQVEMAPGQLACGAYLADVQTAGSLVLLAQSALPCALFASPTCAAAACAVAAAVTPLPLSFAEAGSGETGVAKDRQANKNKDNNPPSGPQVARMDPPPGLPPDVTLLHLCGGTNADMAPPVDYMMHVLLPTLRARLGVEVEVELVRRGYYPRGGGVLKVQVRALNPGATLPAIDLTNRGQVATIHVHAFTAGRVPAHVGTRMADSATAALRAAVRAGSATDGVVVDSTVTTDSMGAGGDAGGVLVTATTTTGCILGASALARKGVTAEEVAEQVVKEITTALGSGTCVDQWMEDQLIIFMALASGQSRMLCGELTLHTRTAMAVAEALTACKFKVHEREGGLWLVECQGSKRSRR